MYEVVFYERANGEAPVQEFLDSLPVKLREKDLEEFDASSGARSSASRRRNGVRSRRFVRAEDEVRERHHSSFLLFLRRADDCCDGRIH